MAVAEEFQQLQRRAELLALMPTMIESTAKRLQSTYLAILEVGGAYAHRFEGLLSFLHIPYLVITDLDSVNPTGYPIACRAEVA